jgi:putative transcriptional regulator
MKNFVKEVRLRKHLTQTELADLVGVSRQTIFSVEINKYVPSVALSLKIARELGKKVEYLFRLEDSD